MNFLLCFSLPLLFHKSLAVQSTKAELIQTETSWCEEAVVQPGVVVKFVVHRVTATLGFTTIEAIGVL